MYRKSLLFGVVLGCIGAILTIELPHIMTLNPVVFVFLLPGVLVSIAAAGHVHGYTTWVATLVNAFLWFAIAAMLGVMFQWSLKVFRRGKHAVPSAEPESVRAETSSQSKPGRSHSE